MIALVPMLRQRYRGVLYGFVYPEKPRAFWARDWWLCGPLYCSSELRDRCPCGRTRDGYAVRPGIMEP